MTDIIAVAAKDEEVRLQGPRPLECRENDAI